MGLRCRVPVAISVPTCFPLVSRFSVTARGERNGANRKTGKTPSHCAPRLDPLSGTMPFCTDNRRQFIMSKTQIISVSNWEEFEGQLEKLRQQSTLSDQHPSRLFFRGQESSAWSLATTLERSAGNVMSLDEYYRLITRVKPSIEAFVGTQSSSTRVTWWSYMAATGFWSRSDPNRVRSRVGALI